MTTPTPTPPTRPPQVTSATPTNRSTPLSRSKLLAWGQLMVELIIAQVAMALGNIDVLGVHPLAFLTQWGQNLEQQASDAYVQSQAAQTTADNAQTTADGAQTTATGADTKANGILDMLTGIAPGSGTVVSFINSAISSIPGAQAVIDAICNALGIPGTGHSIPDVGTALTNIPGLNIVSSLLSSVIPILDASKIGTGTFGDSFVPGLGSIITTITTALGGAGSGLPGLSSALAAIPGANIFGLLGAGNIPLLDGSKIGSGTVGLPFLPTSLLTTASSIAASAISGLLSLANIPSLDASKITTGTFADGFLPSLQTLRDAIGSALGGTGSGTTATTVTSLLGAIPGANIISLAASKISGLLAAANIPLLDGSKIGSGTVGLPFLPTSLLTTASSIASSAISGVLSLANIPTLDGAHIPALDTSKITSGTFADSFLPGLGSLRDTIGNALGVAGSGLSLANITTALTNIPGANLIGSVASSLLSGVLSAGLIPSLDGSKIGSGTVASTFLPSTAWFASIPSSLLSGTLATGLIPGIDASKIVSGIFGTGQIPPLPDTSVPSLNNRVTALEGGGVLTQYTVNGTWTKPSVDSLGVAYAASDVFEFIAICGGDGGGKPGNSAPFDHMPRPGGKDGGAVSVKVKYSDLPSTAAITIGAAGAAGATINAAGGPGGVTSLGSIVTGAKGKGLTDQYRPGTGGQGAVYSSTAPTVVIPSTDGLSGAFAGGGYAGVNAVGANGSNAPSNTPTGGGGGGGGGITSTTAAAAGGTGGFPGGGGGSGGVAAAVPSNGAAGGAGCLYEIRPH